MSKTTIKNYDEVLDEKTLQLLGDAPAVLNATPEQMQGLRDRVMQRVNDDTTDDTGNAAQSFLTVRNHDGAWIEIAPKLMKKVLRANLETGDEAYLLRAEPGAEAPSHLHEYDEHCLVLEGELTFDNGIHLKEGDYHFAAAGSEHGIARTNVGVLVYVQTGPESFHP